MIRKFIQFIMGGAVIMLMSYLFTGFYVKSFGVAFLVAIVLALLNTFVKPVLTIIALPITVMTLGLFQFVVNAFILSLASALLAPDFYINGFGLTIVASIFISILYSLLGINDENG